MWPEVQNSKKEPRTAVVRNSRKRSNIEPKSQLYFRKGTGVSLGEAKDIGAGAFHGAPSQVLPQTDITHSAGNNDNDNIKVPPKIGFFDPPPWVRMKGRLYEFRALISRKCEI